ncbi:MAG: beta-lactamase superfamily metal-dependent hydrolase [Bacteroidetes bacterium]|nr:MAG: beta-lactamase superfamily metal-dependent hydrolase [Bacteroidota bacterium]
MAQTFEVSILGSSSALPTSQRHPTAQLINVAERYFLVDCGEGTQIQLRRYHFRMQRINHILISHLHGDHFFGLVGLLSSMHLLGRVQTLHLYHPPGLKEIIDIQMRYSCTALKFPIEYHVHDLEQPKLLFEDKVMEVHSFPLNHRIPCCGFVFREKPRPFLINKEKVTSLRVPVSQMGALKRGEDVTLADGTIVPNAELTCGRTKPRSYSFCSDTIFDLSVIQYIKNSDLLYHEATFADDMMERAKTTFHSTAREAGQVARQAEAGKLIIGHFSARYHDTGILLQEALSEFPETVAAEEGKTYSIDEQLIVQKKE